MRFFLFCLFALASASLSSLKFKAFSANKDSEIKLYTSEAGKHFVFLPYASTNVQVSYEGDGTLLLQKGTTTVQVPSGTATEMFNEDGVVKATLGAEVFDLNVMKTSEGVDTIFIKLKDKNGSASGYASLIDYLHEKKTNELKGSISFNDKPQGDATETPVLKKVKGCGNTTWAAKKKPYNVNLDNKFNLYGMGAAKKWRLLANFFDASLTRNAVAYNFGYKLNFAFTPQCHPVDLVMDGNFFGNYLICERVEINKERVNIRSLDHDPVEDYNDGKECLGVNDGTALGSRHWWDYDGELTEDVTGGYIIEFEYAGRYPAEASGFVTNHGQSVTFKEPEFITKSEVDFMADFYQEIEDAIYSSNGVNPNTGKHYTEYIDMDSFVKMYILHEFTMCEDSGLTSTYFYKDIDSVSNKLFSGPAWDFDNAIANDNIRYRFGFDMTDPSIWWANTVFYSKGLEEGTVHEFPTIFTQLYKFEDFRAAVANKWKEIRKTDIFAQLKNEAIAHVNLIRTSALVDANRWDLLGDNKAAEFEKQTKIVIDYIDARVAALDKGFSDNAAMVYYDANGGSGFVFNDKIIYKGESIVLKGVDVETSEITREGYTFKHWSLSPEGKGRSYPAGSVFRATKKTSVLYAQWEKNSSFNYNILIIIGGVVGGLILIGIAVLLVIFL